MYRRIGKKIQLIAKVLAGIGATAALLIGILLIPARHITAATVFASIGIIVGGAFLAWLSSFALYGFGVIVENNEAIRDERIRKQREAAAAAGPLWSGYANPAAPQQTEAYWNSVQPAAEPAMPQQTAAYRESVRPAAVPAMPQQPEAWRAPVQAAEPAMPQEAYWNSVQPAVEPAMPQETAERYRTPEKPLPECPPEPQAEAPKEKKVCPGCGAWNNVDNIRCFACRRLFSDTEDFTAEQEPEKPAEEQKPEKPAEPAAEPQEAAVQPDPKPQMPETKARAEEPAETEQAIQRRKEHNRTVREIEQQIEESRAKAAALLQQELNGTGRETGRGRKRFQEERSREQQRQDELLKQLKEENERFRRESEENA